MPAIRLIALLAALVFVPALRAADDDALAPITAAAVVQAPVAEVWKAWTTDEGLRAFLVEGSKVELRPGGPYEIYFSMQAPEGSRGSEGCTVLSYLPEKMLSFQWNAPPKFQHARSIHTWVVINLEELSPDRTRVELTHLGFAEHAAAHPDHRAEWEEVRAYFVNAWPFVLGALTEHFAPVDGSTAADDAAKALELCNRLVGGEWILEHRRPDGASFYSRNTARHAPDGKSLVMDGWLGDDRGMFFHAATQIWIEPGSGLLRFQSINEAGSLMRGYIEMVGEQSVVEHIELVGPEGVAGRFTATIDFKDNDTYDMILQRGDTPPGPPMTFRRVDQAPEKLRTLTDGTMID